MSTHHESESSVFDWKKTTVLITGGTGSFGRKCVETLLAEYQPRKIIVYSRDEWKQHEMRGSGLDDPSIRYFLGDVRDLERLRRAFQSVDVVIHAAALKQVPACEYNPNEAVATNIIGTRNVVDAALDCRVRRVLTLSTDKAAAPTNIYGATKLVAEKLSVHANAYSRFDETTFACVRYGNVLGSRGSVLPLFTAQKQRGRLTLTDPRMTRFWMTPEHGVRFVLSCIEQMHGGEVFVPKLPSMRVLDLARVIAPEAEIQTIGIRAGEKLHEAMLSEDEARQTVDAHDRYVILPGDRPNVADRWRARARPVPDHFEYVSDRNERWLSREEMADLVQTCETCHA